MSRRNHRSWTRETSALAHQAKARKRMAGPAPEYSTRPEPGMLLHTILIESFGNAALTEIRVRQAKRLNQVVVEANGKASRPHGIDWLAKNLRKRLVLRWGKTEQ